MYRYIEIAKNLEDEFKIKSLKAGSKAPSVRDLCKQYQCHQTTALKALNWLQEKDILYKIPQSGFYITDSGQGITIVENGIDFKSSSPDPRLFPYKDYQKCVNLAIEKYRSELFDYSSENGYPPLRKAIVKLLTNDYIFTDIKHVIVTTGIQQGLSLLSEMILPNTGHKILLEQPTYHRYIQYLENKSFDVMTIERRHDGLDFNQLELIFSSGQVKLFYTMPRVHNPLGSALSKTDKIQLIELAYKYDVFIIEDDYMGDYIEDKSNDPLMTYDSRKTHVIYLRSFSKIIFPGLRLGFAVLPDRLTKTFSRNKYLSDIGTSLLEQASLEIYLTNKMYDKHISKMRQLYGNRAACLRESLNQLHTCRKGPVVLNTTIHTCVELEEPYKINITKDQTIKLADINAYYHLSHKIKHHYLPINVSNVEVKQIPPGIKSLSLLMRNKID